MWRCGFLMLQHYGGDYVCNFNTRKGTTGQGKRVSGGDLGEIITYFPESVVTLYKLSCPGPAGGRSPASAAFMSALLIGFW